MLAENEEDEVISCNKKYAFFVVDGSSAMFESENGACAFREALKLVLVEMINICSSKNLNTQVGIIVTHTNKSSSDAGLDHCIELMPLGVPGVDEINEIKNLVDDENIQMAFNEYSDGQTTCDLSHVLNWCRSQFVKLPNTRHQSVILMTNNRNPFLREDFWNSQYFKMTKSAVSKIVNINGRKTLGEFTIIMLPEGSYKPATDDELQNEPLWHLDPEIFNTDFDASRRIRLTTTPVRSHANVAIRLGPEIEFDVGVYSLVSKAQPMKSENYLKINEKPIQKTVGYITKEKKDEPNCSESTTTTTTTHEGDLPGLGVPYVNNRPLKEPTMSEIREELLRKVISGENVIRRNELKKSVELGGEKIVLDQKEVEAMSNLGNKRIDLIGFCPLDRIDQNLVTGWPKILRPNENTTLGSTQIFRALLNRCSTRKRAMICTFQSRTNERMRIVALIPLKIEESEEKKMIEPDCSEYLHEGFHIIPLPYFEELRDESQRFDEIEHPEEADERQRECVERFIRRLTMSYSPGFYENPRFLSEKAALSEFATGEKVIERKDTIKPYHEYPERLERVKVEIEEIKERFSLMGDDMKSDLKPFEIAHKMSRKKKIGDSGGDNDDDDDDNDEKSLRRKKVKSDDVDVEDDEEKLKALIEEGRIDRLTKEKLYEILVKKIGMESGKVKKSLKKREMIDLLMDYCT